MAVAVVHHSSGSLWLLPIVVIVIVVALSVLAYFKSKKHNLSFDVPVGVNERHAVHYFRNAYTGRVRISVDGVQVIKRLELINFSLVARYEFAVGETEEHAVAFVKTRKWLFSGFRSQTVVACVDGVEILAVASPQSSNQGA